MGTITDAQVLGILLLKDNDEVAIGRLARQKAWSDPAKKLADMLVTDHGDHAKKVSDAAKSAGVSLPGDDVAKRKFDELKGGASDGPDPMTVLQPLNGAEFDKKFGELMLQGHRDVIKVLEMARSQLANAEVRALVDKTLPVLKHHEEMARQVVETGR